MAMHELRCWRTEKNSAYLYRVLSDCESGNPRQLLFLELAKEADEQAGLWAAEILKTHEMPPVGYKPGVRTRLVGWLILQLGPHRLRPVLAAMKLRGLDVYAAPETMATSPVSIAAPDDMAKPVPSVGLRTVVFWIHDGLLSIGLLLAAFAGAGTESATILLLGVAGLLVGAVLMAAGEWGGMRDRQAAEAASRKAAQGEWAPYPAEVAQSLVLIYRARGMSPEEATAQAKRMMDDPEFGLDAMVQEAPPTVPPRSVASMPRYAPMYAFFAFVFGGMLPLLPYLLGLRRHPLLIFIAISCAALLAVGAARAWVFGREMVWGGVRMLLLGAVAGGVAFVAGHLLAAG